MCWLDLVSFPSHGCGAALKTITHEAEECQTHHPERGLQCLALLVAEAMQEKNAIFDQIAWPLPSELHYISDS